MRPRHVVPHHDRKNHRLPTRTHQIPAQSSRLAQCSCLGKHMSRQRCLGNRSASDPSTPPTGSEARQSANHGCVAAYCSNRAVARGATRSCPLNPDPSRKQNHPYRSPHSLQKGPHHPRPLCHRAIAGIPQRPDAAEKVRHADSGSPCSSLPHRPAAHRPMPRHHARLRQVQAVPLVRAQPDPGCRVANISPTSVLTSFDQLQKTRRRPMPKPMLCPRLPRHHNSPRLQHRLQRHRRILRWILDRHLLHIRCRILCNRPINPQHLRPRHPFHLHRTSTLCRASRHRNLQRVVRHSRIDDHRRRLAHRIAGSHRHLELVVVDRQCRHRRAITPHRIVNRPVLRIRLPRKQRVISHHIAVDHLQTRSPPPGPPSPPDSATAQAQAAEDCGRIAGATYGSARPERFASPRTHQHQIARQPRRSAQHALRHHLCLIRRLRPSRAIAAAVVNNFALLAG